MMTDHPGSSSLRLIESDEFDFEFLSRLAERESWRKEIHRPIYHLHKWWAKRLGTIFRGIILGCQLAPGDDLARAFYAGLPGRTGVVFDPFMGSGTTIGEAHKLNCTALGRDINPVACESVRVALGELDRDDLMRAYARLSSTVGERIRRLYASGDAEVLYFFWVKQASCPRCSADVDLFSSRIFARNAYPDRKPEVRACCPRCGAIVSADHRERRCLCSGCGNEFDLHAGHANGAKATCSHCALGFSIADAIRRAGKPPAHRLYAKLVLAPDGEKRYEPVSPADVAAYAECSRVLETEIAGGRVRLPETALAFGYNTKQAMNYNYRRWRDFFNDRQLLVLGWLQAAIVEWPTVSTRDALLTLFSGVLEFNNLFASYKGEGTGAVRHMFANHVLKPERTPIEANMWGTAKSSGSFAGLFKTRLLRALDYRAAPTEIVLGQHKARPSSGGPIGGRVQAGWPADGNFQPRGVYLSCGSSDATRLPPRSVDLVITDPPFFDNVHYSELADFFFAWQVLYPRGFIQPSRSTRNEREVQDTDAEAFAIKLRAVFIECHRVLRDDGLLVFSYHHSRPEGWLSLAEAVFGAGFSIINTHPVKAEMSGAAPKSLAEEPIQLDVLLVCRKREHGSRPVLARDVVVDAARSASAAKARRLRNSGFVLSNNDWQVITTSEVLRAVGFIADPPAVRLVLEPLMKEISATVIAPESSPPSTGIESQNAHDRSAEQLRLWSA